MSTYLYDKALVEKLKKWTDNTKVTVISPDETRNLFETIADQRNDKPISLPMMCLRKNPSYTLELAGKAPLTYSALTHEANIERSTKLMAIPIRLTYRIDIYARYYEEADEYMRNLVFNMYNYPVFTINIPYEGMGYTHNASMVIDKTIENTSSSQERLAFGQFTKLSIGFEVKDAYLLDVRTKDNLSIAFLTWAIDPDGENDSLSCLEEITTE